VFAQLLGYRFGILSDGRRYVVRPISPQDKDLLASGLAHLSPASVYRRFLSAKPSFTTAELRYLTEIDHVNHEALIAVLADDPSRVVGVARFVRLEGDAPGTAEVAVTVGDCYQGQGVGRYLGILIADAARDRGIQRFTAMMLADNTAAHRLFATISTRLETRHEGPVDELVVHLGTKRSFPRADVPDLLAA
jgi:RimJ/RimL family protein N-acetyltransferase